MKLYILLAVMLISTMAKSQVQPVPAEQRTIPLRDQARMRINPGHIYFNPAKGFELYKQAAKEGDTKAMNALAILYSNGIGTEIDQKEAFYWFKRAAESGYANAWYNLGSMYRKGLGTTQDFRLAYKSFSKGAEANATSSIYAKGYMLYKGLGCDQSYKAALALFKRGVHRGSTGSMYLLGLSYRNGYGTSVNIDSARFWLARAAAGGYQFAAEEMQAKEPENVSSVAKNQPGSQKEKHLLSRPQPIQKLNTPLLQTVWMAFIPAILFGTTGADNMLLPNRP